VSAVQGSCEYGFDCLGRPLLAERVLARGLVQAVRTTDEGADFHAGARHGPVRSCTRSDAG